MTAFVTRACLSSVFCVLLWQFVEAETKTLVVQESDLSIRAVQTDPAALAVGDRIAVRAGLWDAVTTRYTDWAGISGTVQVQPDGTIMLPMAGTILAAGQSSEEVAARISSALHSVTGVSSPPAVAVELESRRPVIVSGEVMSPGEIVYRPDLTVRQAVALAGGIFRILPDSGLSLTGRQARAREGLLRIDLRIARLEAELAGAVVFDVPPAVQDNLQDLSGLVAVELQIMRARANALSGQTESIDELLDVLTRVNEEFVKQGELIDADIARAEENIARRQKLLDRGLARASDVAAAESQISGLRLRAIDLTTQRLSLEQDLSEALRSRDAFQQKFESDVLEGLSKARDRRRDLELEQSLIFAGHLEIRSGPNAIVTLRVSLADNTPRPVALDTLLAPGDTLVVASATE